MYFNKAREVAAARDDLRSQTLKKLALTNDVVGNLRSISGKSASPVVIEIGPDDSQLDAAVREGQAAISSHEQAQQRLMSLKTRLTEAEKAAQQRLLFMIGGAVIAVIVLIALLA